MALASSQRMVALVGGLVWSFTPARTELACALTPTDVGGFIDIPGGGFVMGVDPVFPEEGPPRKVLVSPFRLQAHEVTNSQFAAFVADTDYVTEAEH